LGLKKLQTSCGGDVLLRLGLAEKNVILKGEIILHIILFHYQLHLQFLHFKLLGENQNL
jgi:hypothetical protein